MIEEFGEVTGNGFPSCTECGCSLHCESSYMASEVGIMPEDVSLYDDLIVDVLVCSNCQATYEAVNNEHGGYDMLSRSFPYDDDFSVEYAKKAQEIYDKYYKQHE